MKIKYEHARFSVLLISYVAKYARTEIKNITNRDYDRGKVKETPIRKANSLPTGGKPQRQRIKDKEA